MPAKGESPYAQFNFLVSFGTGTDEGPTAGFQECNVTGMEAARAEQRGDERAHMARKVPGLHKLPDITLKRGLMTSLSFYDWLEQIRKDGPAAHGTVTIRLQNVGRKEVVQTWRLLGARPVKYTGPDLNAKGNDVAMEELVFAYDRLELDD